MDELGPAKLYDGKCASPTILNVDNLSLFNNVVATRCKSNL